MYKNLPIDHWSQTEHNKAEYYGLIHIKFLRKSSFPLSLHNDKNTPKLQTIFKTKNITYFIHDDDITYDVQQITFPIWTCRSIKWTHTQTILANSNSYTKLISYWIKIHHWSHSTSSWKRDFQHNGYIQFIICTQNPPIPQIQHAFGCKMSLLTSANNHANFPQNGRSQKCAITSRIYAWKIVIMMCVFCADANLHSGFYWWCKSSISNSRSN